MRLDDVRVRRCEYALQPGHALNATNVSSLVLRFTGSTGGSVYL
jgi:hypothetical protein